MEVLHVILYGFFVRTSVLAKMSMHVLRQALLSCDAIWDGAFCLKRSTKTTMPAACTVCTHHGCCAMQLLNCFQESEISGNIEQQADIVSRFLRISHGSPCNKALDGKRSELHGVQYMLRLHSTRLRLLFGQLAIKHAITSNVLLITRKKATLRMPSSGKIKYAANW